MRLEQVNHEPVEPAYRRLMKFLVPILPLFRKNEWHDQHKVPQTGPVIFVANHISNYDAIAMGEYLVYSGRWPRFLGKSDVWKVPILGWLGTACGQIPVYRHTERASEALIHAEEALAADKAIFIFPEGTITADPDGWPMTGRTGVARLALKTGCPVVPIGQWGGHKILGRKKLTFWGLFGRPKLVKVICGDEINLDDLRALPPSREVYQVATVRILDAVTELVEQLRNQPAPKKRYHIKLGYRVSQRRKLTQDA